MRASDAEPASLADWGPLVGPTSVDSDGRLFLHANGEPFFWLGDTAWALFGEYSRLEAERYLENRARKGSFSVEPAATAPSTRLFGPLMAHARCST